MLIDILVLSIVSYVAFDSFVPPLGERGFWFYTALLSILVGTKLLTPFYVKPVDAVAYAVPAFVALMVVNQWAGWPTNARVAYVIALTLTGLTGGCAFIALILHGWGLNSTQDVSNRLRLLVDGISSPAVLYSPIMIFAMLAFHYGSPKELVAVSVAMLLTTTFSIGELSIRGIARIRVATRGGIEQESLGLVAAYQKPGIYLLRSGSLDERFLPSPLLINDELTGLRLAYAVDTVGREGGHLCRAIELKAADDANIRTIGKHLSPNHSLMLSDEILSSVGECARQLVDNAKSIRGLVAQDTTVGRLNFEVTENDSLSVGRLVAASVNGQEVHYQLVAGLTREEVVHNKNTYGYLRAQAQQIGVWDGEKFNQCRWLPEMHGAVHLEDEADYDIRPETIGRFPKTNYAACIGDIHQLVTHNTAILGILGVGKSMLGIELVERMLAEKIKVICLDLTNQYAQELSDFYCEESEGVSLNSIQEACARDRDASADNPEQGGSLPNLKQAIFEDLESFLSKGSPQLLKIYNPSEFVATRQEHEPRSYQINGQWHRGAGLYAMTPVEATQMISEAALRCVSDEMTDRARVCLVYEEAHALVPEWNSVVVEGDKRATSGTARAILQGRKYGLGCLLITQRTANVTKTILNQCNTIFAMRTFDETGKEFLANYLGHEYSDELSSLPERHAVFFGRGSNCENPVLIALNDRDKFREVFRSAHPPPSKDEMCKPIESGAKLPAEESADFNDDIPF